SPAPSPVASINVQASNGWFDIAITDPSDSRPGLFYFAESDSTPAFAAPRVYFMGASRNLYVQLGNQTLYWRAYSQYIGSLLTAHRSPGRRRQRPRAAAFHRQRHFPQRRAAQRQRLRHPPRLPRPPPNDSVTAPMRRIGVRHM